MNISALLKFLAGNTISKDDFLEGFKAVQEEGKYSDDSIFADDYTKTELQNIFELFDVNKDGQIDQADRLKGSMFSEEMMSEKDLELLVKEFNNMIAEGLFGPNDSFETVSPTPKTRYNPSISSGGDGGNKTPETPKTEDYSSMTASELRNKLDSARGTLTTNQEALNKIINGTDSALAGYKDDIKNAENNYRALLEEVAPDLAEKYEKAKDDLDAHNQAIADKNVEINETQSNIDSLNASITNLDNNIKAYDVAIADLEAARGQENAPSDLESKISDAKSKRDTAQKEKDALQKQLTAANEKLNTLKAELDELNGQTEEKENAVKNIETEINKLNNSDLTDLKQKVIEAQNKFNDEQAKMLSAAQNAVNAAQAEVDKIQSALNTVEPKEIKKNNSLLSINNPEAVYETLGLDKLGLNKDVFMLAMEGYNNLEDKGNGFLGIFDTTQSADKERYYLLDLNKFELVGRSVLKIGSGNMDNIKTANKDGSHATLSGFEMVGGEYYSDSMGKNAMRLIGLEEGINDNALAKGTVVHYTTNNTTWGCKGFTPVITNGKVDIAATEEKMHRLFPKGTIIFTNPTDSRYREYSALV